MVTITVAYMFLLSYVSDKQLLNRFGLKPDTHSRGFHQHVAQGFQILIHPMFFIILFVTFSLLVLFYHFIKVDNIDVALIIAGFPLTAYAVGWLNANSTAKIIQKYSQPYMILRLKHRNEAMNGVVILQDAIKLIFYFHDNRRVLVAPWTEVSEYISNPERISDNNLR